MVGGFVAGNIQSDELSARTLLTFCQERATAVEMPLVEIDQPSKTQFQRRAVSAGANRMFRGYEIHIRTQKPCLEPSNIERLRADCANTPRAPRRHQGIPDRFGVLRRHPQLIAEVAGEAGARCGEASPI